MEELSNIDKIKEWVTIRLNMEQFVALPSKVRDSLPILSIVPDDHKLLDHHDHWKEAKKKADQAYKELKKVEWSIREKKYQID